MNVSNAGGELRRPQSHAYTEDVDAEDTDTLSELSENELLFGFLNPTTPLTTNVSLMMTGQQQVPAVPSSSVGD